MRSALFPVLLVAVAGLASAEEAVLEADLVAAAAPLATTSVEKAGPTDAEVGDADSFGRNVKWLGLLQAGSVTLTSDCTPPPGSPPPGPDQRCITLNPAPAVTSFDLPDIGRMTLPKRSTQSLLCHWLSPIVFYNLFNGGVAPATGSLRLSPYLEVYSEVLADPSLVDPSTGLPFGGRLETGFAATYVDAATLDPGGSASHRFSESRTCIAGFLSRRSLVENYGLSEAQARDLLRGEIALRFGLRGSASLVTDASIIYGLRVMGD